MVAIFKKIFGTAQTRMVKRYDTIVQIINEQELQYQSLTESDLISKTQEFKKRVQDGQSLEDLLPEAFALVKNACRRLIGKEIHVSGYSQKWDMIPYDVQLIGAIAMFHGSIAEMQTGEGKTLTATLPLFLYALQEKGSHLVTVNDYLAKRDCEWMSTIFTFLGLSTGFLTNDIPPQERKGVYEKDIVYGTASEFGFDYLRDNSMALSSSDQVQKEYFFAIIDEVDSILIDEARTPLIISGPSDQSFQMYDELKFALANIVKKQQELLSKLANDAKNTLDNLDLLLEDGLPVKLNKEQQKQKEAVLKDLWLVSKGAPNQKVLKKVKEHPDIRAELEKQDTLFYSDQLKKEKIALLSNLYIIIDERASEFELTDKGIDEWKNLEHTASDNFTILDLGEEYAKIDAESTTTQEKMDQKQAIRDEDAKRKERYHNIKQLLRAHLLMEKDVDYIIQNDKIIIIDENTGRPQPGRRFSDGLHQAIEAKESVKIQEETQTYATITLQNYFRMYDKLAGMSGTAMTEAKEFKEIYKLDSLSIPTYKPSQRVDGNDEVYMTEREKYTAILKEIEQIHAAGRPILLGTESVEVSEKLSRIFKQNGLPHTVLNARQHDQEAEIIASAGQKGAITIATNMAGRGTDIKLGENVANLGGLAVIGTTRHQSRRIDRQLRGRCARLGDPGTSKFFVSFEDSLIRMFASPKMTGLLQRFRPPEGEAISSPILTRSIETAQKRIEQRNFTMRKHTLEYDDVMNKQRKEVYAYRQEILSTTDPMQLGIDIFAQLIGDIAQSSFATEKPEDWQIQDFLDLLMQHFPITFSKEDFDQLDLADQIEKKAFDLLLTAFQKKMEYEKTKLSTHQELMHKLIERGLVEGTIDSESATKAIAQIIRSIFLSNIDRNWQQHLLHIDHLRAEVYMRSIGQKDPLMEFKHESFTLFDQYIKNLRIEVGEALFKF